MSIITQFYLLQYKNWKLQFRKKLVTAFEIILPALFCLLVAGLRTLVIVNDFTDPTLFPTYGINRLPDSLISKMNSTAQPNTIGIGFTPNTATVVSLMENVRSKLVNTDTLTISIICKSLLSIGVIANSFLHFVLREVSP